MHASQKHKFIQWEEVTTNHGRLNLSVQMKPKLSMKTQLRVSYCFTEPSPSLST